MANSFYTQEELKELGFRSVGDTEVLISRKASIYGAANMDIGNHVRIDDFCILSGRISMGNYIHISAYTALYGGSSGIELADFTTISSRCAVFAESDDYSGLGLANPMVPEEFRKVSRVKVVFEKYAMLGSGGTVLPGGNVREGAAVGCMSLVNRDLEPWGVYAGIPCRKLKDRSKDIIELEKELREKYR